jgi:hypothetical protein
MIDGLIDLNCGIMIKRGLVYIGLTGLVFSSCIKHEVIPAPTPLVDLEAHFFGVINGTDKEYTDNVVGYANASSKVKIIQPPGGVSTAVYYAEMSSSQVTPKIKVGLGSINFDSGVASDPTLTLFNDFFPANDLPAYSDAGAAGFEVSWTDISGREWLSTEISGHPTADVQFTGITQESDETGDYSKFTCYFECMVYSLNPDSLALPVPVAHIDSLLIEDAVYNGWFRR